MRRRRWRWTGSGLTAHAFAVSFIVTNIGVYTDYCRSRVSSGASPHVTSYVPLEVKEGTLAGRARPGAGSKVGLGCGRAQVPGVGVISTMVPIDECFEVFALTTAQSRGVISITMERLDEPAPHRSPGLLDHAVRRIGLGEMDHVEIHSRYGSLKEAIDTGLSRHGEPATADRGLLAVRTEIPLVTQQAWEQVPAGAGAIVASVAGTNWDFQLATKEQSGGVALSHLQLISYPENQRAVPFDVFVQRIAAPIVEAHKLRPGGIDRVGLSFGFPHRNAATHLGIDAQLLTESGHLPKRWKITDWLSIPAERKWLGEALRKRLSQLGIAVRSLAVVNDTAAVALDSAAAQAAREAGLEVLPAGVVGGTGTNAALDSDGLVNLEIGHTAWPDDAVSRRMRENGWTEGDPDLEQETGMYLPYRLASGIQILGEQGLIPNAHQIASMTLAATQKGSASISQLADGGPGILPLQRELARCVLRRAAQVYGLMLAAVAEAAAGGGPAQPRMAMLAEGSVLLQGRDIKALAQETSASLGQPLVVMEASGLRGVGSLVMSLPGLF